MSGIHPGGALGSVFGTNQPASSSAGGRPPITPVRAPSVAPSGGLPAASVNVSAALSTWTPPTTRSSGERMSDERWLKLKSQDPDTPLKRARAAVRNRNKPLTGLPPELLQMIVDCLLQDSPYDAVRDVNAVMRTSQALCNHATAYRSKHPMFEVLLYVTREVAGAYPEGIVPMGRTLGYVQPERRGRMVEAAVSRDDHWDKSAAIASLGTGLEHLNEAQCQTLIGAAVGLPNSFHSSKSIIGLGKGLEHLSREQRKKLVTAAIPAR